MHAFDSIQGAQASIHCPMTNLAILLMTHHDGTSSTASCRQDTTVSNLEIKQQNSAADARYIKTIWSLQVRTEHVQLAELRISGEEIRAPTYHTKLCLLQDMKVEATK